MFLFFVFFPLRSGFYSRQRNRRVGVGVGPWENTLFLGWTISLSPRLTVSPSAWNTFFPISLVSGTLYCSNKLSGGPQHKSVFLDHVSCQLHVGGDLISIFFTQMLGAGPNWLHEKKSNNTSPWNDPSSLFGSCIFHAVSSETHHMVNMMRGEINYPLGETSKNWEQEHNRPYSPPPPRRDILEKQNVKSLSWRWSSNEKSS